LQTVRHRFNI